MPSILLFVLDTLAILICQGQAYAISLVYLLLPVGILMPPCQTCGHFEEATLHILDHKKIICFLVILKVFVPVCNFDRAPDKSKYSGLVISLLTEILNIFEPQKRLQAIISLTCRIRKYGRWIFES